MTGTTATAKRSASELLNRVWLIVNPASPSSSPAGSHRLQQPTSQPGSPSEVRAGVEDDSNGEKAETAAGHLVDEPEELKDDADRERACISATYGPSHGAYFSFPSFDMWEELQHQRGHGNSREIET